jgi:hypothetical protein
MIFEDRQANPKHVDVVDALIFVGQDSAGRLGMRADHAPLGFLIEPSVDIGREKLRRLAPHAIIIASRDSDSLGDLPVRMVIDLERGGALLPLDGEEMPGAVLHLRRGDGHLARIGNEVALQRRLTLDRLRQFDN